LWSKVFASSSLSFSAYFCFTSKKKQPPPPMGSKCLLILRDWTPQHGWLHQHGPRPTLASEPVQWNGFCRLCPTIMGVFRMMLLREIDGICKDFSARLTVSWLMRVSSYKPYP
jgi:hypothetical protein